MISRARLCALLAALAITAAALPRSRHQPGDARADDPKGDDARAIDSLDAKFAAEIRPLLKRYCHECHAGDRTEAEIDLAAFTSAADVRQRLATWQKVGEMLDGAQMPPPEADQPSDDERQRLHQWVREFLSREARVRAGDPGRVVLRRLSNAEYAYALRDLTNVESLDPGREFPVDGAAGEGFTNAGAALVVSPALVSKYLDAAKQVAGHAVLLPDGFRFSPRATRSDWTSDALASIGAFYDRYTDESGGTAVNVQGIEFETNRGGRLPLARYLTATLEERDALQSGKKSPATVAAERGLNARYLETLWSALSADATDPPSLPLDAIRKAWRAAQPADVRSLVDAIGTWQAALWKFNPVGHIGRHLGREDGPATWMEAAAPIAARRELRISFPEVIDGEEVAVHLVAGDAGDGAAGDVAVWERPRLVIPGRADLPLRDVRAVSSELQRRRELIFTSTAKCLAAASEALANVDEFDLEKLASKHAVETDVLAAWLDYLGIGATGPARLGAPIERKIESSAGYDFVKGWVGDDALSVVANSSDNAVRIPGNVPPHGVCVHPTPSLSVSVGWRSPIAATLKIEGVVRHAHPECGNGVAWGIELRRGHTRQTLASGFSQGAAAVPIGPLEGVTVRPGDVVSLTIGPRDANHSCDLTSIDMTLDDGQRQWNMGRDLSPDILAGNPHDDSHGNAGVWHFFSEPANGSLGAAVPAGSVLARWQTAADPASKAELAAAVQDMLNAKTPPAKDSPDGALYRELTSLRGPLLAAALKAIAERPASADVDASPFGLDPREFGTRDPASPVGDLDLCVTAPSMTTVRLPASLVAGAAFAVDGTLHPASGREGTVQLRVETTAVDPQQVVPGSPVVTLDGSTARGRVEAGFDAMRQLFPAALCYRRIVPVDEAVTLTLYYREDEQLRRLMLDEQQAAELDRLWDELFFIAREPVLLLSAFEQIAEYATQDRPDMVKAFAPMRKPINDRAAAFRQRVEDSAQPQLAALAEFAERAWRRPLASTESDELRQLYARLRQEGIEHEEAFRLTLARVLVAPAFLYRIETPAPGEQPHPVSDWELASRLSFLFWSSVPDEALRSLAASGKLAAGDVPVKQAQRMLRDPKVRRLAAEFACQWLHIYDFAALDEKSERHFPTFVALRDAMHEESLRFFTDLFQNDGSVLSLLDADHTFLNEDLARHYGIEGVVGKEWRRVDGLRGKSRGGILTQASILAKQAGASRTSPILRGNWLSEVVLGEKLPRPPKNVPPLADEAPAGLTERQLIERHSTDPACAKCHSRIDPFGFALENFDAIGRYRDVDAGGLKIDARTSLADGTRLDGLDGLKNYLLTTRRDAFVRQFCKKLLGYSLGRSVQLSDEPLLEEMQAALAAREYRVSAAIEAIVASKQFRYIRGADVAAEE